MTTLLSDKDTQSLKDRFRRELKQDVTIRLFTQRTFGLTFQAVNVLTVSRRRSCWRR